MLELELHCLTWCAADHNLNFGLHNHGHISKRITEFSILILQRQWNVFLHVRSNLLSDLYRWRQPDSVKLWYLHTNLHGNIIFQRLEYVALIQLTFTLSTLLCCRNTKTHATWNCFRGSALFWGFVLSPADWLTAWQSWNNLDFTLKWWTFSVLFLNSSVSNVSRTTRKEECKWEI